MALGYLRAARRRLMVLASRTSGETQLASSVATSPRLRIVMLVPYRGVHHTRVRREAATLADAGHRVHVIVVSDERTGATETFSGASSEVLRLGEPNARRETARTDRVRRMRERLAGRRVAALRRQRLVGRLQSTLAVSVYRISLAGLLARWALEDRIRAWVAPWTVHRDVYALVRPRLERRAPDVLHAYTAEMLYAAWRHARTSGSRLVYDTDAFTCGATTARRAVLGVIERVAVRAAHVVLAASADLASALKRRRGVTQVAVVLDAPPRHPEGVSLHRLAGLDAQCHTIVVAPGGEAAAIDALEYLPPGCHLGVLEDAAPALVARAARAGRAAQVHPLPRAALTGAIYDADVVVLAAPADGRACDAVLPGELLAAAVAGAPVAVATARAQRRLVLGDDIGCEYNEASPRDLAVAIGFLLRELPAGLADPERHAALIGRLCWEKQGAALLNAYARLPG